MLDAVELLPEEQFTKEVGGSFGSVRNTIVHTYSAEYIWLSRWTGESPAGMLAPDNFLNAASVRSAWTDLETKLREVLRSAGRAGNPEGHTL